MADVFISWRDIECGDFPDCCLSCGADGTELVQRRLQTFHYRVVYGLRRYAIVELPFCVAHRSRSWVALGRTDAREFTDEGVWIKNASPHFAEDMERYRHGEKRRGHKKRRMDHDDDWDHADNQSRRRGRPPQSTAWVVPLVILAIVLAPVVALAACCFGSMLIPVNNGGVQPGFNAQPGFKNGPPFGPIGRKR